MEESDRQSQVKEFPGVVILLDRLSDVLRRRRQWISAAVQRGWEGGLVNRYGQRRTRRASSRGTNGGAARAGEETERGVREEKRRAVVTSDN